MSAKIMAQITCDGCGKVSSVHATDKSTYAVGAYWRALREVEGEGWIKLTRYGTARHFCKACADKPIPRATKQKAAR